MDVNYAELEGSHFACILERNTNLGRLCSAARENYRKYLCIQYYYIRIQETSCAAQLEPVTLISTMVYIPVPCNGHVIFHCPVGDHHLQVHLQLSLALDIETRLPASSCCTSVSCACATFVQSEWCTRSN